MFGIGGGEFIFIIFIILMFFGSDKIPEMARALGKGIAQLKNATNDIKSEIHQSVKDGGVDLDSLTGGISEEISKAKEGFSKMVNESETKSNIQSELDQIRENFSKITAIDKPEVISPTEPNELPPTDGPVKRES